MLSTQRTLTGLILVGLLNLSVPLGLAASTSLPSTPEASSVSGSLLTRSSEGADWSVAKAGQSVKSQWFKTGASSEAVIAFAGDVHMRMSPNTIVHVESSSEAGLNVDVPQGDVMTSVPDSGKTSVNLTTPNGTVRSSGGNFMVKVDAKRVGLEVLEGNAQLSGERVTSQQLPGVSVASLDATPGLLAEAGKIKDPDEKNDDAGPDDPNTLDDDEDEGSTVPIIVGTVGGGALLALLLSGHHTDSGIGGSGTPASP